MIPVIRNAHQSQPEETPQSTPQFLIAILVQRFFIGSLSYGLLLEALRVKELELRALAVFGKTRKPQTMASLSALSTIAVIWERHLKQRNQGAYN